MPSVFLCHSSDDKPVVERIANDLEAISVDVWFDKWELRVGDSLLDKIAAGVSSQDYLIAFLSQQSVESKWVRLELNAGLIRELEENRVVLLPALLEDCAVPALLKHKKWADFRPGYEHGLDELLAAILPHSASAITRSKGYRTALHLIAGLSQTDCGGVNTLNDVQLLRVYDYRRDLSRVLGDEEQRLLFWSASAFQRANPRTPWFMNSTVPVWGLVAGSTPQQRAQWIVDGLSGTLFQYLIRHARWAYEALGGCDVSFLMYNAVLHQDEADTSPWKREPLRQEALRAYVSLLATYHRTIFDEIFIPGLDASKPNAGIILEATAELEPPPPSDYYSRFSAEQGELFLAGLRALVHLGSSEAVRYLRAALGREKALDPATLDAAFSQVGISRYAAELAQWLGEEERLEIRARLLTSCINAGHTDSQQAHAILCAIAAARDSFASGILLPSVVRAYFRSLKALTPHAVALLRDKNPLVVEAAVYGVCRLADPAEFARLVSPLAETDHEDILAAVIECGARAPWSGLREMMPAYGTHASPLVRSAYYRALGILDCDSWAEHLVRLREERHPLVRLCGARVLAGQAESRLLDEWASSADSPAELRTAADEALFAPEPFRSAWLAPSGDLSPDYARLPVRLASMDPDRLYLDTNLDLDRQARILMTERR